MRQKKHKKKQQNYQQSFPLSLAGEGEMVRIVSVHCGRNIQQRLLCMGIQIDDVIKTIQCRHGAVLIAKNNNRYVLGSGMALKIQVVQEK